MTGGAAAPAELGDHGAGLVDHLHVVDAAAPGPAPAQGGRGQFLPQPDRSEEGDLGAGGQRDLVALIAGHGEGRVGEGEEETAVHDVEAVQHVVADQHGHDGVARLTSSAARGIVSRTNGQ